MLFLVMAVLNNMFCKANTWSVLQQLPPRQLPYRVSMYADDVVLFLTPSLQDLQLTTTIFDLFKLSSGLCCNVSKCQIIPIRCDDNQFQLAHDLFPYLIKDFFYPIYGNALVDGQVT
jgi:hypothetical protein